MSGLVILLAPVLLLFCLFDFPAMRKQQLRRCR